MKMTIEEAIRRIEDVVKRNEEMAERDITYREIDPWKRSTEEHRQLAEWLKELKSFKEKDEPKAVRYVGDGYADGSMVYDYAFCPSCEHETEVDSENICGIPHKVIECEDNFNVDTHFGQIDYKACEIRINKDMATEAKEETICHEMVHGILVHLGYTEQSQDETFVQALGNAIYQGFKINPICKDISKGIEEINKLIFENGQAERKEDNGNNNH